MESDQSSFLGAFDSQHVITSTTRVSLSEKLHVYTTTLGRKREESFKTTANSNGLQIKTDIVELRLLKKMPALNRVIGN